MRRKVGRKEFSLFSLSLSPTPLLPCLFYYCCSVLLPVSLLSYIISPTSFLCSRFSSYISPLFLTFLHFCPTLVIFLAAHSNGVRLEPFESRPKQITCWIIWSLNNMLWRHTWDQPKCVIFFLAALTQEDLKSKTFCSNYKGRRKRKNVRERKESLWPSRLKLRAH